VLVVHCDTYITNISYWNSPFPSFSISFHALIIFPFTYMYTQYLHHIHPLCPFPTLTPSHWYQFPQTGPPVLQFCKRKNWHVYLFKIAVHGVSLQHFHVYLYYNLNQLISSIFLLSNLSPLLMVISTGLKILYSYLYGKYINYIHLLNFLLLPSLSHMWPPFSVTCFS
jgi:hypothetical protein